MHYSLDELVVFFQGYLLPFFRISALFMVMPVIGTRVVPARVKIILAFLITVIVAPLLNSNKYDNVFSAEFLLAIAGELLIGGAMGFVFLVVFQCFVLAGQIIAVKIGLGFASMNDPVNGVQTTVVSQFYLVAATLLFIVYDGHLVLIEFLIESFRSLPVGQYAGFDLMSIVLLGSWLFSSALLMTIALLTALLLVNISFGVMSRAAPQLNIFAVGFPFTLLLGIILIFIGLDQMLSFFERLAAEGFMFVRRLIKS